MAQTVEAFDFMAPVPASVQASCVARKDSWEPASRRYRDIEVIEVSK